MEYEDTLIGKVYNHMETDEENIEKESAYLQRTYEKSNEEEKKIIDNVFMSLCGYRLITIIKGEEIE